MANGKLGRRCCVLIRRIEDDDAVFCCGLDIDVIDADARTSDCLQPSAGGNDGGGNVRLRADNERVVVTDALLQGGLFEPSRNIDAKPGTRGKHVPPLLMDWVCDENSFCGRHALKPRLFKNSICKLIECSGGDPRPSALHQRGFVARALCVRTCRVWRAGVPPTDPSEAALPCGTMGCRNSHTAR